MARRRKRKRNPAGAKFVIGAGLFVLTGLLVWDSLKTPPRKKRKQLTSCDPRPYEWNAERVAEEVQSLLDAGERDASLISLQVATTLFGIYPEGGPVEFPPAPGAPAAVGCVWSLVTWFVEDKLKITQAAPQDDENNDIQLNLRTVNDWDTYPWEIPSRHPQNEPMPGSFVDAGGYTGDELIKNVLSNAIIMAANAGIDTSTVQGLAHANSSRGRQLRKQMRSSVIGNEFNDGLYGQTDVDKAGGNSEKGITYVMNPKGRGLNWNAYHADNLDRLLRGLAPKRVTNLEGDVLDPHRGNASMLLWIPAIDLRALCDRIPSVQLLEWSDGSSTSQPPPVVRDLGVDLSGVELPGGVGT